MTYTPISFSSHQVLTSVETEILATNDAAFNSGLSWMVGAMVMWPGSSAPTGWILCDGSSLLQAGTYADLFAIIGTTYGSVDGSHFNVPDLRSRVPIGVSGSYALASTGGEATHTLTTAELTAHSHTQSQNWEDSPGTGAASLYMLNDGTPGGSTGHSAIDATDSAGGGGAHNNLQPYLAINYILKY